MDTKQLDSLNGSQRFTPRNYYDTSGGSEFRDREQSRESKKRIKE
jgi:hypothetical protein